MFVWVQLGESRAVEIDTNDCRNVDGLIKSIKKELSPKLDSVAVDDITLWTSSVGPDGAPLLTVIPPDTTVVALANLKDFLPNNASSPLIIKVFPMVSIPVAGSSSSISCKSQSTTGRCATGRHVDRRKNAQGKFRRALLKRDVSCVATGTTDHARLTAAHILPLEKSQLFERKWYFSPKNGVLLRKDLEDDYDRHMWYFDENGDVIALYQRWNLKELIPKVNLATGPDGPSVDLIRQHNEWAMEEAEHHCPYCWKYVGKVNVEVHQLSSCEEINNLPQDEDDSDLEDEY